MASLASRVAIFANLAKNRTVSAVSTLATRTYATEANPEDYGYCKYLVANSHSYLNLHFRSRSSGTRYWS